MANLIRENGDEGGGGGKGGGGGGGVLGLIHTKPHNQNFLNTIRRFHHNLLAFTHKGDQ